MNWAPIRSSPGYYWRVLRESAVRTPLHVGAAGPGKGEEKILIAKRKICRPKTLILTSSNNWECPMKEFFAIDELSHYLGIKKSSL